MQQAQRLESLGVLAGGIAHDFNNLLTALLGNLNLAHLSTPEDSPAVPYLESAETTVLRASELTQQMLAYSGKGRFIVKLHDLNHLVQEMTHLLQVSIPKKVVLHFQMAEALPPVEADSAQIQQVILNLVTNASDAIGNREGAITIRTESALLDESTLAVDFSSQGLSPGRFVALEVADTGGGIPPEIRARIFEPFFTTKPTGRGLGLSAMLGILRGHRAGIQIRSELGQGSTFRILFPEAQGSVERPTPPAAAASSPTRGTVLLVDDEPMILEMGEAALSGIGCRVLTARDGLEAVETFRIRAAEIDLVVMDLTMPRMDGLEAFAEMQRLHPEIPVILSSGFSEQESIPAILGRGLAGFLQKPYTIQNLRTRVQTALSR
jgi:CheY-like chemotaxis protein